MQATQSKIIPVILCGGAGTRLWPLSRPERPKQLLRLTGAQTMLQMTAARVSDPELFGAPILVANQAQADEAERQLAGTAGLLIVEPVARNTAPAIALAALALRQDDLLLVMPSDHLIQDVAAFRRAVETARPLAAQDWLVTFGIAPTRPETGYGYIKRAEPIAEGAFRAERFVEKPDRATAQAYLDGGGYDWNGGIFLLRAGAVLAALGEAEPAIAAAAHAAMADARREARRLCPETEAFAAAPPLSIDHAVMERAGRIAVVPVDMGWSDIGSWDALYEAGDADAAGNVLSGDVTAIDAQGCLLKSDGPRIVAVGVSDLIVISTEDAVLIVPRGESQRVKEALDAVSAQANKGRGLPPG